MFNIHFQVLRLNQRDLDEVRATLFEDWVTLKLGYVKDQAVISSLRKLYGFFVKYCSEFPRKILVLNPNITVQNLPCEAGNRSMC